MGELEPSKKDFMSSKKNQRYYYKNFTLRLQI